MGPVNSNLQAARVDKNMDPEKMQNMLIKEQPTLAKKYEMLN